MANSTKASREALREKIAKKGTCGWQTESGTVNSPQFCGKKIKPGSKWCAEHAQDEKDNYPKKGNWARLRQVAAGEEAKDVDAALAEVADALGTMADAMGNLREHLDLIEAPKTASLRVRIAAAKKYASTFKRLAEESPEIVADALSEVYHSLDDVAGAIETLAENMGVELSLSPAEEAFGEEGKEEIAEGEEHHDEEPKVDEVKFEEAEKEITPAAEEKVDDAEKEVESEVEKEAAGSDWFTTDRDEEAKPKAPVLAAKDLKPGQEKDGDKTKTRCKSCGAFLVKGKCPVDAKTCGRNKKDAGATEWTTDRDEDGEPKTPVLAAAECSQCKPGHEDPKKPGYCERHGKKIPGMDKKAAVPGGLFAEDKQWDIAPDPKYDENPPDDWEECGQCECYHPAGYTGDCRSDINRWPSEKSIAALTGGQSNEPNELVRTNGQFGMGASVKDKVAEVSWKSRLQDNYDGDFEQFQAYDDIYGITKRLGFSTPEEAWQANPEIGGSTNPDDFQVIDPELDDPDQWEEADSYVGHTRRSSPVTASGEFFITDRDNDAKPVAPEKLEIPEAQGETEVGKSARAIMREKVGNRK